MRGHAVLQPRVTPTLPSTGSGTVFQQVFSGPRGTDPYAFATSDVYQDLFDEGIYTGKGIYDVDAFERALAGRVPDNALLSHDLFEGLLARACLLSDVEIFEGSPGHYGVAAMRGTVGRGATGSCSVDLRTRAGRPGRRVKTRFRPSAGGRCWTTSAQPLCAGGVFATLLAGWRSAASPALWSALVAARIFRPGLLSFAAGLIVPRRRGIAKRSYLRRLAADLVLSLSQGALRITLLAHQAWMMTDAIARTLARLLLTRRRLLEWVPARQTRRRLDLTLAGFFARMAPAVLLAAASGLLVAVFQPRALPVAFPLLAAWLFSPAVARWISLPPSTPQEPLAPPYARVLRSIARRTWRYFDAFAGSSENALPPDNFQETPQPVVARRTSPTPGLSARPSR